jgi:hypothetical protein
MRNSIFSLLLIFLFGCSSKDENVSRLDHVPVANPNELIRFNEIGDNLLSHIGYNSVVLEDGHILIPDRQHVKLFKADSTGELIETIGRRGNGPGEFQDITFLSKSAYGNILIYDQMNQKVIVLDSLGQYDTEFSIPSNSPSGSLSELHEVNEQQYLMIFRSNEYIFNENSEQVSYLVTYDIRQNKFSPTIKIDSRPYARRTGGGGGARVPYAAADLFAYDYKTADIYLYKSDGQRIAQLDTSLDTVQVLSLDIESELITRAEFDTLRAEYLEYWESMQNLLPEYKAAADQLMIDHKNNFWLKLNHSSEYQQWLVASGQGELLQNVQLPKGSILTHISEKHLGVRLDDITFALFEFPQTE